MREEVLRYSDRPVPVGLTVGRLHQRPYIADHCDFALAPKLVQASQARMKSEFGTNTGNDPSSQQARLRYRQSTRFSSGGIGCVVVIRNNHITAVIATVQKNANQGLIIGRLS